MTASTVTAPGTIEPLRSWPGGRYEDDWVVVEPGGPGGITAGPRPDGRIAIRHRLRPSELDDELAGPLAEALAPLTVEHEVFARAFTGVVLTARPHAATAWELFYRNSLARIRHATRPGYAAVYRHALQLLPATSVADVGCGFGFLSLHLASRGAAVSAWDCEPGTTALVRHMASRLGARLDVRTADGASLPLPAGSADAVVLLHVLEHVPAGHGTALLAEAIRVARRRVVVAVPFEDHPTALFGHVRSFTLAGLATLGAATGLPYRCYDHHGGWLILDRPSRGRPPGLPFPKEENRHARPR